MDNVYIITIYCIICKFIFLVINLFLAVTYIRLTFIITPKVIFFINV